MNEAPLLSIVVPTFNEAAGIAKFIECIEPLRTASLLELILVDDSSSDGTANIARGLGHSWITVIERVGARDLGASVVLGVQKARGDVCVVMDADLSHDPRDAIRLANRLLPGDVDIVVGSRYVSGGDSERAWGLRRWLRSQLATIVARRLIHLRDPMSGFFALRPSVLHGVTVERPIGYKILLELVARMGSRARVAEIPICFHLRHAGTSKCGLVQHMQFVDQVVRLWWHRIAGKT